jgi:predicted DNA-binding transcriptional regulator AlpA
MPLQHIKRGIENFDLLTPSDAARRLGIKESHLFDLWRATRQPRHAYLGPRIVFRTQEIENFARLNHRALQALAATPSRRRARGCWVKAAEQLEDLKRAYETTKRRLPKPFALYRYMRHVHEIIENHFDLWPTEDHFAECNFLCNELMKYSTDLTKSMRSISSRTIARAYALWKENPKLMMKLLESLRNERDELELHEIGRRTERT